jgi:hypothetical protein
VIGPPANGPRAAIRSAANANATRSVTSEQGRSGHPNPVEPVPVSAESVSQAELPVHSDIDSVFPTWWTPWQEALVEVER